MEPLLKKVLRCGCATAVLLIYSCSVKHVINQTVLYQDNDFAVQSLKNNRLVVGGIASKAVPLTDKQRLSYSDLLSEALFRQSMESAPSMDVVQTRQLVFKTGEACCLRLMKAFDTGKEFDEETCRLIRDTLPDVHYILYAVIENETDELTSSEKHKKDDKDREVLETTYRRTVTITVEYHILDLAAGKTAWAGSMKNTAKRKEEVTENHVDSLTELAVNIIFSEDEHKNPARIPRKEILEKMFEEFAENLLK
ncbi:hypothetical protein JW948_12705 [bacterium]|nr:hypothetical protein [bacterium]